MPRIVENPLSRDAMLEIVHKAAGDPLLTNILGSDGAREFVAAAATMLCPPPVETLVRAVEDSLQPRMLAFDEQARRVRDGSSDERFVEDLVSLVKAHIHLVPASKGREQVRKAAVRFARSVLKASAKANTANPRPRVVLTALGSAWGRRYPKLSKARRRAAVGRLALLLDYMAPPPRFGAMTLSEQRNALAKRARDWE